MADICFLPVCSECGEVLWDVDVAAAPMIVKEVGDTGYKYLGFPDPEYERDPVSPNMCKKCGAHFETIRMPTRLPFRARKKEPSVKG